MIRNGIDTGQVQQFTELLTAHPDAAEVAVRTTHRWDDGYALTASGDALHVGGQTIARSHVVASDRPARFGGGDRGPAPGELVLAALAACIGGQLVEHAAVRGIDLDAVELSCEGRLDLRGSLAIGDERPGLQGVDVHVDVGSSADEDTVRALLDLAVRTSPVADSLRNSVPLSSSLGRVAGAAPAS